MGDSESRVKPTTSTAFVVRTNYSAEWATFLCRTLVGLVFFDGPDPHSNHDVAAEAESVLTLLKTLGNIPMLEDGYFTYNARFVTKPNFKKHDGKKGAC